MLFNKNRKVFFNFLFFTALISFGLIYSACNELPTDVGSSLLFDTVTVMPYASKDTNVFKGQRTFFRDLPLFNVGVIYVGNTDDTKAAAMLRFAESSIPDSLSYLDENYIQSVTLTLYPYKYTFGDTLSNYLSFKVVKAKTGAYWSNKANWDSVFNSDGSTKLYETNPIGQWQGSIPMLDTIPAVNVNITDFSFVKEWIKNIKDTVPVWGLGLIPDENSKVIHSFVGMNINASTLFPIIKIVYKNKNSGKIDSVKMTNAITSSVVKAPQIDSSGLYVQGGTSWRSQLFFDLSVLPKNASIYRAQLELTYNPSKSKLGNLSVDSVLDGGLFLDDSIWIAPDVKYYASYNSTTQKYKFPKINSSLEYWLRRNGKGNLVLIAPGWSEYFRLDRVAFFGINDPDPAKRPKLTIIYSKRPY